MMSFPKLIETRLIDWTLVGVIMYIVKPKIEKFSPYLCMKCAEHLDVGLCLKYGIPF